MRGEKRSPISPNRFEKDIEIKAQKIEVMFPPNVPKRIISFHF
jgi:hypothetical protein